MNEITRLLNSAADGKSTAPEELLTFVYQELRQLAAHKMAGEAAGHTLQATALVHEAWLRLGPSGNAKWESRAHFFGAAAEAMRRILVDHARRKQRLKRGCNAERDELHESMLVLSAPPDEVLAVHEVLDKLAKEEPRPAEVVKLLYFVGLSQEEAAAVIGMSAETVKKDWAYARKWLHAELARQGFRFAQPVRPEPPPQLPT